MKIGEISESYPLGFGYCQCGCQARTKIYREGMASLFVPGHNNRTKAALNLIAKYRCQRPMKHGEYAKRMEILSTGTLDEVKPLYELGWGRCQCGCGSLTKIIKGKACRFIHGHYAQTEKAREISSIIGTKVIQSRIGHGKLPNIKPGHKGSHLSIKNDRNISYMSTYEKRAFEILDVLDNVASYEAQPFIISYKLDGRMHRYIPDVFIRFKDNRTALVEIKPRSMLSSSKVIAKAKAAITYCQTKGIQYMIWTEDFLLLQGFKREKQVLCKPIAKFMRLDYIESVLKISMEDIKNLLNERKKTIIKMFHPRA
jgi:hypothetical protein